MDEINSLYITLSSDWAVNTNDSNTHSEFYIDLSTKIKVDESLHEIGLSEITYEPCKYVFGTELDDNVMKVQANDDSEAILAFIKEKSLPEDISSFNKMLKEQKYKIEVQIVSLNEVVYYKVDTTYTQDVELRFNSEFQSVLGFDKSVYRAKSVIGENPANFPNYNILGKGTVFSMKLILLPDVKTVIINEPHEHNLEGLVTVLNESLIEKDITDLAFVLDEEIIKIDTKKSTYRLTPSPRLLSILGTTEQYLTPVFQTKDVDLFRGNHNILLHTNLISPQIYNGYRSNLLRQFEHKRNINNRETERFDPVYYCSLKGNELGTVHIRLTNESGALVFFNKPVTCVLHIKSRTL